MNSPPTAALPPPATARHERTRQRRARMLELVDEREFVGVKELSDEFGLTEMSVRRDLTALEAEGLIARVRGGATRPRTARPSRQYAAVVQRNAAADAWVRTSAFLAQNLAR